MCAARDHAALDDAMPAERPLASAGPVLVVAAIALVAVAGLVLSLFRDPGLPAHVAEGHMRVAGGLVTPAAPEADAARLSAVLAAPLGAPLRVPILDRAGFRLTGGTPVSLGGAPAAVAIYRNDLREFLVWHVVAGDVATLPGTSDAREVGGRRCFVHYKGSTTLVFWQEGPLVAAISATLPAEQVMAVAAVAVAGA